MRWEKKKKKCETINARGGGKVGNSGTIAVEEGTERFRGAEGGEK